MYSLELVNFLLGSYLFSVLALLTRIDMVIYFHSGYNTLVYKFRVLAPLKLVQELYITAGVVDHAV